MIILISPEDTPLIIDSKVLVVVERVLELIMLTADPVTPLTVVINELADELLDTEFTAVVVEVTPFTDEVRVLAEEEREFIVLLARSAADDIYDTLPVTGSITMIEFVADPVVKPLKLKLPELVKLVLAKFVAVALLATTLSKVGLLVKVYITVPLVLVETVKLLYGVEEAKKLYKSDTLVVAVTPLTMVVSTPAEANT